MKQSLLCAFAGIAAGSVTGLFGAGGGMVLVPLLCLLTDLREDNIFPSSVSIILPICFVSLILRAADTALPWGDAVPYLIGSGMGGILSGIFGRKISAKWLHRLLGIMILWGGIRYLC
jgi:uncharacterized membrane protein YfcA